MSKSNRPTVSKTCPQCERQFLSKKGSVLCMHCERKAKAEKRARPMPASQTTFRRVGE